jgi:hypothetical protein
MARYEVDCKSRFLMALCVESLETAVRRVDLVALDARITGQEDLVERNEVVVTDARVGGKRRESWWQVALFRGNMRGIGGHTRCGRMHGFYRRLMVPRNPW